MPAYPLRRPAEGSARGSAGPCLPGPIKRWVRWGPCTFGGSFCICARYQYGSVQEVLQSTLWTEELCNGLYKNQILTRCSCYLLHYVYEPVQTIVYTITTCTYLCQRGRAACAFEFDTLQLLVRSVLRPRIVSPRSI